MKKKLLGIFVCMLLIATAIPVIGTINVEKSKPVEKNILKENEESDSYSQTLRDRDLMFTWLDSDWDYTPRSKSPGLLHPYTDVIIVFGCNAPGPYTTAPECRIQAAAAGGARILGSQGNTPDKPAIGFFSTDGVDDGDGYGLGIYRPLAHHMAFSTLSQERMRITDKGKVGIGTTYPTTPNDFGSGPNSQLHVDGSFATAITTVIGGTTYANAPRLTQSDHIVFVDDGGGGNWVVLPYAYTCPGRQYMIKNIGSAAVQLDCEGFDLIENADPYNPYPLNSKDAIIVVSNGEGYPHTSQNFGQWWIMSEFIP